MGIVPDSASWFFGLVPEAWRQGQLLGLWSWQWLGILAALFVGLPLGYLLGRLLSGAFIKLATRTSADWDDAVAAHTRGGIRFGAAWTTLAVIVDSLDLPASAELWVELVTRTPLILTCGWLTLRAVHGVTSVYLEQAPDHGSANRRGLRTQISILRRLSSVVIVLVTGSLVLLQFELMRSVGLSLLASAGVAGVALGFAAKESLANVIAGLQLSFTQTIRLGDSVVVDGQWAKVEEIALTYVRLRLLDDRHLVVPVSHMLSHAFENWSAGEKGLIGIVELAVDPSVPVDQVRAELERLARAHDTHDGRECRLQVLDLDERRALLRARVSSGDLDRTFQMRCDLREALLGFLQRLEGGRYLARQRFERVEPPAEPPQAP